MKTITFYSYKGGVGRTLAAANFAVYLAKLGMKTVIIDFDLEAPGIDAKFPLLKVPENQKGILDYILYYQQTNNDPGDVAPLALQVPVDPSNNNVPLWLIPGGQYLSEEYYKKLSQLDWNLIFSEKRDGVAFFQQFMVRLEKELQPNFVIIDSRTGITEIAGLCTQQLADEVVMLSSMSRESIKVTKHIKRLIEQSKLAEALEKSIDVKVVVSRVPKPENLEEFKKRCCEIFAVEETKLFFLFSCSALEREEFLAIFSSEKDEELVSNYVRLFYGLSIEIATENIRNEIAKTVGSILSVPVEESEKKILELVALYPHPEVYRTAMRFFQLVKKDKDIRTFAWKLFDAVPNDEEVQDVLSKIYLADLDSGRNMSEIAKKNAIRAIEPLWQSGKLNPTNTLLYATVLEDTEQYSKSLEVILPLYEDEEIDQQTRLKACSIAAKNAAKLEQYELAEELIKTISPEHLNNAIALIAMEIRQKYDDIHEAFEIGKQVLARDFSLNLLKKTLLFARQLNLVEELEEALLSSPKFQRLLRRSPGMQKYMKDLSLFGTSNKFQSVIEDDYYVESEEF